MTAHFLLAAANELGYDPATVDPVIELARKQFSDPASHVLDAAALRTSQFKLIKGGYQIAAVDAALDRLDDVFAQQEANRMLAQSGHEGAKAKMQELRKTLQNRIARGKRKAFKRQPWWLKGYSIRQVDSLLKAIDATLDGEANLSVGVLRQYTFAPKWAAYNEAQVDAFIDRTVQYLQISKALG
jgi:DivIVA domain-containing protein